MTIRLDESRLLAGCDDAQIGAITSKAQPLLVLAGAGSGKTRVLTRRVAWRVATDDAVSRHVLALTFTRKAARELRIRLSEFGLDSPVTAGTFHAIALAQLRQRAIDLGQGPPVVLASKASLLGPILKNLASGRRGTERDLISVVAGEIEWAKARLHNPSAYLDAASQRGVASDLDIELAASAYVAYEEQKRRRHLYDFEDLLVRLADEIERDADFRAAQRWRFRHLFVDELQDANPAQLRLLDSWRGDRSDLFAVGDPDQSIYGWNGADRSAVTSFAERYEGATVLSLDTNYRSTPQIVAVASSVLDRRAPVAATRPDGVVPVITSYANDEAEAKGIASAIRSARRRGFRFSSCAVLTRTNAQLALFERAFETAAVPWRSTSANTLFSDPVVRDALSTLDTKASTAVFCAWLDDVEEDATLASTSRHDSSDDDEPESMPDARATTKLLSLVELGRDYLLFDPRPNGDGFLAFAREALRTDPAPSNDDGVELSTFHRAKGLEWPVVFVAGLEMGFVPIARAKGSEALDEEERLLYVALSRAIDELYCSWAMERSFGSRVVAREPSPYLEGIATVQRGLGMSKLTDATTARDALASSRAALEAVKPRS